MDRKIMKEKHENSNNSWEWNCYQIKKKVKLEADLLKRNT